MKDKYWKGLNWALSLKNLEPGMTKCEFLWKCLLLQPVEEKEKITKLHQQGRSRILLKAFCIWTFSCRAFLRPLERISLLLSCLQKKTSCQPAKIIAFIIKNSAVA
jgi:hypothetical protein